MSDNEEIKKLLKNIQEGLRIYGLQELNEAIVNTLNDKHDKTNDIDYVLNLVCEEFRISKKSIKSVNIRGNLQDAKQVAYCLLHFDLGLSLRHISERIFFNSHTSIANGIMRFKNANVLVKQDKEFIDKYNTLQAKLKSKFAKQNKISV